MTLTVVQAAPTVHAASLTTATVTLGSPATAGNTLVACITTFAATTHPVVAGLTLGGAAGNWRAAGAPAADVFMHGEFWYDPGCAGGQSTVVVTCTGGSGASPDIYIAVYEVSGVLASDQSSGNGAAAGATAWTSQPSGATTQAAEILFGVCSASTAVPTVGGVGTWTTQSNAAGSFDQIAGYQIVTSLGAAEFSGTIPAGAYTAAVVTFSAVPAQAGSWEQLRSIYRQDAAEREFWASQPPRACPNDGTPLEQGPNGSLHCRHDGFQWPRDGVSPR